MFVRTKKAGKYTYLQIVHNKRIDGRVRQQVVGMIGRLDILQEDGKLDGLLISLQQFSKNLAVIGAAANLDVQGKDFRRIGAALVFGRLWQELGIARVLEERLRQRRFGFSVERALFVSVLHRLFAPGSDRQAERWQENYRIAGAEKLSLQHFYRAMLWLGTPLPEEEQDGATPFSPRCMKDLLEEDLFARRRDLFTSMDLVFFDTTSIYFEGEGGESLGQYGHTKDHRPDLKQMVVGMVLDSEGYPVCAELWPGNTADVTTLLPMAKRLKQRFGIERVCVVADRGMISDSTKEELKKLGWHYILGVRMRQCRQLREILAQHEGYQDVTREHANGKMSAPLKVKEIKLGDERYIICLNEEEARKDAHDREIIVSSLRKALKHGDKSLVGNKGYRRYLRAPDGHFTIDEDKVADEARYDGKWVLTTDTDLSPSEVALKYKQLWMVEDIIRSMKSILETRPIYHRCDAAIRGHVCCSFLALMLRKELQNRLEARRKDNEAAVEWADIIRDLDALGEMELNSDQKRYMVRTEAKPAAVKAFAACGVALPKRIRKI